MSILSSCTNIPNPFLDDNISNLFVNDSPVFTMSFYDLHMSIYTFFSHLQSITIPISINFLFVYRIIIISVQSSYNTILIDYLNLKKNSRKKK